MTTTSHPAATEGTPLGAALAALADADPQRTAITHEGRSISRAALEQRTNRLARAYARLGVTPGAFVTIGLPNGIELYEAAIATWKLGAIPQPVSAALPGREVAAIIELADPALVVGIAAPPGSTWPAVAAGYEPAATLSDAPLPPVVSPSFKAPTSGGSTGRPKIIVSSQRATVEEVVGLAGPLRMVPEGVHLVTAPLYHNAPFNTSVCALLIGCELIVMSRFDAARALQLIDEHRVDWMYAVPTMMLRIWRLPEVERLKPDLSSLRTLFHLAAPCPEWLKREWIEWLGPDRILELYAATEAQAATLIDGHDWLAHPGSVGRAYLGEITILGRDGTPAPPGEIGEVWMRRGPDEPRPYRYIGAEPRQRAGGWESVGDLGSMDEDGYLYLSDRDADLILVGGANVYPAEVEAALDEHPAVQSSCVIGLPDDDLGNRVHAIVELREDVGDDELLAHLAQRLARYKLPRSVERVAAPLRDDAGKVRRSALRAARL
ncbi:MAG: acid--CoA ligase [Acidimicrobiales bacterium]|nr:acid--CoA ligase [Acidimicrobiales bacterium]